MQILETRESVARNVREWKAAGKTIGLVPTMGFLHEGHLHLVDLCRKEAEVVMVTIFVNPTQFGPNEDLDAYPRNLERDLEQLRQRGVDAVFCPAIPEMYASDHSTWVVEDRASIGLCGGSRPGHFKGVLTVCLKLFNLSGCDVAVFGQKDAQQVTLIEKMVHELDMPLRIVRGATIREPDGLAKSSRNAYLSPEQRFVAPTLHRALEAGRRMILEDGVRDPEVVMAIMSEVMSSEPAFKLDYLEIVDRRTLMPAESCQPGSTLVAGAAFLGKTRLIDNIEV
jgi:pantoate--beta-alanine ligase